jgi:hypothetical protein
MSSGRVLSCRYGQIQQGSHTAAAQRLVHGQGLRRNRPAARHAGFFDFSSLPVGHAAPAAGFLHYAPDFVYRYTHVPGITVGQAIQTGSDYTRRLATPPTDAPHGLTYRGL